MIGVAYTHGEGERPNVFTQCSKCETVFRLSAEVLRAAGGQVRCGRCGDVFNALARLAEDATSFTQGESSFEMETRADEILQSLEPVEPVDTAPVQHAEISHLEILDSQDAEFGMEASLEFTLPPGELDRIFIETRPTGPLLELTVDNRRAGRTGDQTVEPPPSTPLATPVTRAAPARTSPAVPAQPVAPAYTSLAVPTSPGVPPPVTPVHTSLTVPAPPAAPVPAPPAAAPAAATQVPGLEVSEEVRQAMLSSFTHAELPEITAPRRSVPFAGWLAAAVALSSLLAVQFVRANGDWLAAHTHLLGRHASLHASLEAYQLRQWGVSGDPAAIGTLRVRASIMNTAAQLQPYPLLRVSLANRFGARVGEREFEPAEYLGKAAARMLSPGERVDATLDIVDPGNDAEGFQIDVCVRGTDKKTLCVGDAAATDAATQAH